MPKATLFWYDVHNRRVGYHFCRKCEDGQDIDEVDIRFVTEARLSRRMKPCKECDARSETGRRSDCQRILVNIR